MAYISKLRPNSSKPRVPSLLLICVHLIIFAGCASNDNPKTDFQYFKLDGLNRLLHPASLGSEAAYIHHALSRDGQLAPPADCGIGSLEDMARAALVYLRYAEISGAAASLSNAQKLLATILHLQKPDGLFYNWLDAQGRPALCNADGVAGFGFPETRAMWALAAGVENIEQQDREFAEKMHAAFWRSFAHVDSCLADYGRFAEKGGMKFPQWLPYRSGADAASELILAFDALLQSRLNDASQTTKLEQAMRQFAEGIHRMQAGDAGQFPYGAHLAYESYWHGWGNCAMQALAIAGAKFNQQEMMESAILEADRFVPYLQERQFARSFNVVEARQNEKHIEYFPQSAADIRPLVMGLLELSRVTGNRRYARRAGEVARWFRGENKAHEAIYVATAGLAKDFIQGHNYVVPALTAASTVEALMVIIEVEANSDSRKEFYAEVENVFEGKP
jgi:hypothetical protein